MANQQTLIEQVYMLAGLNSAELSKVTAAHQRVNYKRGDILLRQGQVADEYAIIESGLIRSYVHDFNGNDITTSFFGENDIVIEVSSLFQRIPSQEVIQAVTDCVCWKIQFDRFQELYHSLPGLSEWGRAWMAMQLFHFKQRSVSNFTMSAMERYLQLLTEKPGILQQAPLKQIATYLGVTDSSLSRIRKTVSVKQA
ncbi:MAG: Crp/Fnr family transcriptional regulator [Chitinophagaceae bacterium]|nr:MAG: Crp/Fnr family transcriptional regulator [Chitinophagaceae bacterium]